MPFIWTHSLLCLQGRENQDSKLGLRQKSEVEMRKGWSVARRARRASARPAADAVLHPLSLIKSSPPLFPV
jgi:hypothetical protein